MTKDKWPEIDMTIEKFPEGFYPEGFHTTQRIGCFSIEDQLYSDTDLCKDFYALAGKKIKGTNLFIAHVKLKPLYHNDNTVTQKIVTLEAVNGILNCDCADKVKVQKDNYLFIEL